MVLPVGGLADPRGLFVAGMLGTLFTHDPFFSIALFAGLHYMLVWPPHDVTGMPIEMNFEFIVTMLMLFVWGVLAGVALLWGLGSPVLIPTHTTDSTAGRRRRLRLGIFALAFSLVAIGLAALKLSGIYTANFDWGDSPVSDDAQTIIDWVIAAVFSVLLLATGWMTVKNTSGSPLTLVYYGKSPSDHDGGFIIASIVALVLVLAPSAIFDFTSAPGDRLLPLWQAGLITLGVEILMWTIIYFGMNWLFHMNHSYFNESYSGVPWPTFVIFVGSMQIITGAVYIVLVSPLGDADPIITLFEQVSWLLIGSAVFVFLAVLLLMRWGWATSRAGGYATIEAKRVHKMHRVRMKSSTSKH